MDKKIDKRIKDFIAKVAVQNDLNTAYLFGSYAKGISTKDSDIDVALIINHLQDKDRFDLQVRLMLLASDFDTRIEPHPISEEDFYSGSSFVEEIKRTGIEIPLQKVREQQP